MENFSNRMSTLYLFHTGFVRDLFGVTRRTIYRWIENGLLPSHQLNQGDFHLFSLVDINKRLVERGNSPLTLDQIWDMWENYE